MVPSKKALEAAFPSKGAELRALLTGQADERAYASVKRWCVQCHHTPRYQARVECAVNEILEGHGTEAIFSDGHVSPDAVYINMGDTYNTTLLYDCVRGRWLITCWGNWLEAQEKRGKVYA